MKNWVLQRDWSCTPPTERVTNCLLPRVSLFPHVVVAPAPPHLRLPSFSGTPPPPPPPTAPTAPGTTSPHHLPSSSPPLPPSRPGVGHHRRSRQAQTLIWGVTTIAGDNPPTSDVAAPPLLHRAARPSTVLRHRVSPRRRPALSCTAGPIRAPCWNPTPRLNFTKEITQLKGDKSFQILLKKLLNSIQIGVSFQIWNWKFVFQAKVRVYVLYYSDVGCE
jgi:hypothetical protein